MLLTSAGAAIMRQLHQQVLLLPLHQQWHARTPLDSFVCAL
jgi:hypothetical protein